MKKTSKPKKARTWKGYLIAAKRGYGDFYLAYKLESEAKEEMRKYPGFHKHDAIFPVRITQTLPKHTK